jgi:hypothetical protein
MPILFVAATIRVSSRGVIAVSLLTGGNVDSIGLVIIWEIKDLRRDVEQLMCVMGMGDILFFGGVDALRKVKVMSSE